MITVSKIQELDVIDISDGKKVGNVKDIEINLREGRVTAIILPSGDSPFRFFKKSEDYVIPMDQVIRMGEDIILVDLKTSEF